MGALPAFAVPGAVVMVPDPLAFSMASASFAPSDADGNPIDGDPIVINFPVAHALRRLVAARIVRVIAADGAVDGLVDVHVMGRAYDPDNGFVSGRDLMQMGAM